MDTENLAGKSVSHYLIIKRLGEGGMGVVYQAEDTRLKRLVALKFVRPDAGRGVRENARFQREAEAAAALNHPHIATIHEIGEADGRLFIAMEFVDGPNLREFLRSGPLDLPQGLDLAVQLAGALQAAHEKGIIHRDIKTDNIMLASSGGAKVMDFGLARPADLASGTLTAGIVGTVPYMSPEQACGEAVDHRTDIWSLGVVLYEMFTGRHPFRADNDRAMLTAIITGSCEPLTQARPGLPLELERIVGLCLEKQPGKRYQQAADLKADLDRLNKAVAHRTLTSAGNGLPGPGLAFYLKKYRKRILAVLGAAAFLAILSQVRPFRGSLGQWLGIRSAQPVTSLAVLPFVVSGGDDKDKAFAAGLVELLTSKLTQVERFQGSLRVVPAAVAREFGTAGVEKARKALKVDQVITGGMQFREDKIVLTLHLNDARKVRILKSVELNAPRKGLGALPEDVAGAAAGLLGLEITPQVEPALAKGSACRPEAMILYIQGKGYLQRYENPDSVDIAIGLFRKAVEYIDNGCAVIHAELGQAYRYKFNLTRDRSLLDLARREAETARDLDKEMPEVHVILGVLHRLSGNREESLRELALASRLDPRNEAAAREMGSTYEEMGRFEEAETSYRKAIDLKPESWSGYQYLGVFYYRQGRYPEAEKNFQRITELTPDNLQGYNLLGALYLQTGKSGPAVAMFERSLALKETPEAASNLGTAYFFQEKYPEAAKMYEKAITLGQNQGVIWGNLGDAYRFVSGSEAKSRAAYETAVRLAREDLKLNPVDGSLHRSLARYLALLGEKEAALSEMAQARKFLGDDAGTLETAVQVYELCGRRDEALGVLSKLAGLGSLELIEINPDLAELRKDPRFREIVAKKR